MSQKSLSRIVGRKCFFAVPPLTVDLLSVSLYTDVGVSEAFGVGENTSSNGLKMRRNKIEIMLGDRRRIQQTSPMVFTANISCHNTRYFITCDTE